MIGIYLFILQIKRRIENAPPPPPPGHQILEEEETKIQVVSAGVDRLSDSPSARPPVGIYLLHILHTAATSFFLWLFIYLFFLVFEKRNFEGFMRLSNS